MLRTVRAKLIALVLSSTLTSGLSGVVVGWMLWREIEETSADGVDLARVGITHGVEDDIGGLFVTARALATCCASALASGGELPRAQMEQVAAVLMDSYQDEHIRLIAPNGDVLVSYRANPDTHDIESDPTAGTHVDLASLHTGVDRLGCAGQEGLALRVVWEIEDGGGYVVEDCSPYTQPRLQEESRSLHLPLALVDADGHGLSIQTDGFPSDLVQTPPADPRIVSDGEHFWIAAHFEAVPPTGEGTVPVVAAYDITKEVSNLRRTALAAIVLMGLVTLIALFFGWRIARRMSNALTRVSHAHKKIADQQYVHVSGVRTGDELEDLANGFNSMVDGLKERDKLKTTFGKYMTPSIVEHLMAGKVQLGGESLEVSILFSDIRDFTSISERMDAHELVALLNEGYTWGPTSPAFIACAVLAVLFLFLFFRTERRAASPLLDLELLGRKPFLIGNLANFLCYACLFGVFFVIPFVLVRVYQDSALAAGLRLSILPVMLGLTAPIGGALSDRFGSRTPTTAGMLVCVVALVVLHLFLDGSVANLTMVTLALGLFGVGQGLFVSPNSSAVMGLAPPELTGEAGSVLNVMRFLGVSAGIASSSTVLALSLGMMRGGVASTVTAPAPILIDASRSVIVLLICLAAGAGLLSLVRPGKPAPRSERTFVPE